MNTAPRQLNLGWHRFIAFVALISLVPAMIVLMAGTINGPALGVIAMFASMITFFAYRWASLKRAVATGQVSEAAVLAAPERHFLGPLLPVAVWFIATLMLTIGVGLYPLLYR